MRSWTFAGLIVALAGWAGPALAGDQLPPVSAHRPSPASAASLSSTNRPQGTDRYTIVGYLEKRDRVIIIKSGPRSPVYSVATKDGKLLFENLSLGQLKAQAPEMHEFIKRAIAGGAGGRRGTADARLRVSAMN